jgi:hypothetical protein
MYEKLFEKPNVVGVGVGYKQVGGEKTSELSFVVMVSKKVEKSALKSGELIPLGFSGIPTDVVETGELKAFSTTGKHRPAPGGVSIGHKDITAGTLGVVLESGFDELVILSNNHILANSNAARIGDEILQPGPYDGGKLSTDQIATLEKYVPIKFNQSSSCPVAEGVASFGNSLAGLVSSSRRLSVETEYNLVDAAIALPLDSRDVAKNVLQIGSIAGSRPALLGMPVRKYGRTTDYTEDVVNAIHATVDVSYGGGNVARFEEQIVSGAMSAGGDSGSLIVHRDSQDAVGLLFAGSASTTIYSPIDYVLDELELTF